jgi:hypothetical protein
MTVKGLKEAIVGLPEKEMERDFSSGRRGAHLLEKVKADIAAGKFRSVESH